MIPLRERRRAYSREVYSLLDWLNESRIRDMIDLRENKKNLGPKRRESP